MFIHTLWNIKFNHKRLLLGTWKFDMFDYTTALHNIYRSNKCIQNMCQIAQPNICGDFYVLICLSGDF